MSSGSGHNETTATAGAFQRDERIELLARLLVTMAMLAILLALRDDTPGLSGVVVGLVGGHWLPGPRKLRMSGPGSDANGHG